MNYHDQGSGIVGVCLDEKGDDLEAFPKANPLPRPQVYEPGGLEKDPTASGYGIIALPTMILVDSQGKVVNRNPRTAAELETQLEKVLASKGGVALGAKRPGRPARAHDRRRRGRSLVSRERSASRHCRERPCPFIFEFRSNRSRGETSRLVLWAFPPWLVSDDALRLFFSGDADR